MNLIMSGMCLMMKGLRLVMNGSLVLNSTRLARFWTALVTSFRVRDEDSDGLPVHNNNIIHAHIYTARIEYMLSDIWMLCLAFNNYKVCSSQLCYLSRLEEHSSENRLLCVLSHLRQRIFLRKVLPRCL